MDGLVLRLDAPLMSFGGVIVDQHGVIDRFPGLSLITGLIGNALGYRHADSVRLDALQRRLVIASRWDAEPEAVIDYQTVDLGQEKMRNPGWTTRGTTEHREGGPDAKFGTHQRYRHYWANGILTMVVAIKTGGDPDLNAIANALRQPMRPLFLGRKACLPSSPIFRDRITGTDVFDMLKRVPAADCAHRKGLSSMPACWPAGISSDNPGTRKSVHDLRDWNTQLHTGARQVEIGFIEVTPCT